MIFMIGVILFLYMILLDLWVFLGKIAKRWPKKACVALNTAKINNRVHIILISVRVIMGGWS